MLQKIVKYLTPPIAIWLYRKIISNDKNPNMLFEGDDSLFKKVLNGAELYGEYGCGKSTKWVLNNTAINVFAVDSSKQWVDKVLADNTRNNDRLSIKHIDLGELGEWGRPVSYVRRKSFDEYTNWMWTQPEKPSVVLVDGRFRVCCFLTCLKYADEGTRIIFDDYINRPHYHIIEKYAERSEECGRQCLFIVPPRDKIDFDDLEMDIVSFRHVMD